MEICDYKHKKDLPEIVTLKIHFIKFDKSDRWERSSLTISKMDREIFCIKRKYKTIQKFFEDNFIDLL